jgi:alpha-mannosidase
LVPTPETNDRISHWLGALRKDFFISLGEISFSAFFTFEKLDIKDALSREFAPVKPGQIWGADWKYGWFKAQVDIPEGMSGKPIALSINTGGEALLYVDRKPFGTVRHGDLRFSHHLIEDNVVEKGAPFELVAETYSGHWFPGCVTGPVLGGALEPGSADAVNNTSHFGLWNEDAYQLWIDAYALNDLMETLEAGSLQAAKIAKGLRSFTNIVDFEQPLEGRIEDYRKARAELAPLLAATNGSTTPEMYGVGHAHIDVAWLWPIQETARKTARTFAAQLRHLERYPEYKFIQSQPYLYKLCKEDYPDVYEDIKKASKEGRWICEGASWVEPDTNIAGGEALIRQIMHGKRFFKEEFDVDCKVFWLPDTFGYSGALPQILAGCGLKYLFTQKIFWTYNESELFPFHSFSWEGIDGSKVKAFLSTSYGYATNPSALKSAWSQRRQPWQTLDKYLMPFGYGDGGGGPCRDDMELGLRAKNLEGSPKFLFKSPVEFFEDLEDSGNTYTGELYFSAHRGVYTSQAKTKALNRRAEFALREAEAWAQAAKIPYPKAQMNELWQIVLLHQFHDILPGSSIARVYEESEAAMSEALGSIQKITADMAGSLISPGNGIAVFNSLSWDRKALLELPESFTKGAVTDTGEKLPTCVAHGKRYASAVIPSFGVLGILPDDSESPATVNPSSARLEDGGAVLENGRVFVKLDACGEIVSLSVDGWIASSGPMNRFRLYKDTPRTFDAWDIDAGYDECEVIQNVDFASIKLSANCPLSSSVVVERSIGNSSIKQTISLDADSTVLKFETAVEWNELHRLLKVDFPTSVNATECACEIQFGYIKRPARRSTRREMDMFEFPNQKYTALSSSSRSVAVLNDCKYGVSALNGTISLTLLRAPSAPAFRADNGEQKFTYAFTASTSSFQESDIIRQGYELNVKPLVLTGLADSKSFYRVSAKSVILETAKPAEDGNGVILRLYEATGGHANCSIDASQEFGKAYYCDLLEGNIGDADIKSLEFKPFEIKTIRLAN